MMNAAAIVPGPDGVRPPNGTRVVHTRHASRGGQAYPKEMREQVLEYYLHGGMDARCWCHCRECAVEGK